MAIDPQNPGNDQTRDNYDEQEEHDATGEGMPQSPAEVDSGEAE